MTATEVTEDHFVWTCQRCDEEIEDGDGWLTVDNREVHDAREKVCPPDPASWAGVDLAAKLLTADEMIAAAKPPALFAPPAAPARWAVYHKDCDPAPGRAAYYFDVKRIRSSAQVDHWTEHLSEKDWLQFTDWLPFILAAANSGKFEREFEHKAGFLSVMAAATRKPAGPPPAGHTGQPRARTIKATRASEIELKVVRWLLADRIPRGALTLLGGREGIGKSTYAYTLAADLTSGRLPGVFLGTPKAVLVAATEDSWSHTIAPRLMAAGADLELVYRIEVEVIEASYGELTLPTDVDALAEVVADVGAGLILLDPLLSRLDSGLDTHKDADVRKALEPITRLAEMTECAVVGLIHVNKTTTVDPLTALMGSRAFAAVARAVMFIMVDPENDQRRLLGQPKNNLGRTDLPTLRFAIESALAGFTTAGDELWVGKIRWDGESDLTITTALEMATTHDVDPDATDEAVMWLEDFLKSKGGKFNSVEIKAAAKADGHAERTLKRAKQKAGIKHESTGWPRRTFWMLAGHDGPVPGTVGPDALGRVNNGPTTTTGPNGEVVGPVGPVGPII